MTVEFDALEKLLLSEIKRLDQMRDSEARRVDGRFEGQETAVNAALSAVEKAVAAALAASEKAVNKAEGAQLRVNETQNEFRLTLSDQAKTLMPRSEFESVVRELRGLLDTGSREVGDLRSRLDIGPPSLGVLQARSDTQAGRQEGAGSAVRYAALAIGAFGSIVGILGAIALLVK